VFVDRVDECHENTYKGIIPHGHYCIPILSGERLLGVLNLYVREGHKKNMFEEAFLYSVANTLAGIIERKQAQESLENAYEALKSVDVVKDDIISNVSHELRTPITIIKGALEMVGEEEDAQARNKLLEMARKALAKQNRIVGNLVEMAQVQKKKLELSIEEIDLDYVVALAVGEMKHDAEGKEIKIEQEVPDITVMADFERIKEVLLNLLDNAVKFTDRGRHIKVSAEMKDNMAEVCVEDTGIGIPEEFHEKIFDTLFQADATTTRRFAGTGMGLAVAREIVEAHGGKIRIEGKDKGSRLCFTLPIYKQR
jgi:signal transduction histidine kinase